MDKSLYPLFKELHDMGFKIPQEMITGRFVKERVLGDNFKYEWNFWSKEILDRSSLWEGKENIPTTDADNLGKLLPSKIRTKDGYDHHIQFFIDDLLEREFCFFYSCVKNSTQRGKTFTSALLKMLIWIVKEGHVK